MPGNGIQGWIRLIGLYPHAASGLVRKEDANERWINYSWNKRHIGELLVLWEYRWGFSRKVTFTLRPEDKQESARRRDLPEKSTSGVISVASAAELRQPDVLSPWSTSLCSDLARNKFTNTCPLTPCPLAPDRPLPSHGPHSCQSICFCLNFFS